MQKLVVLGGKKLKGQIKISGSKNASLPILAATILSDQKIHLSNLPKVKDIETMLILLESLGSKIKLNSWLILSTRTIPLFTTIPMSISIPIMPIIDIGVPVTINAQNTPVNENSSEVITDVGSTKDSNKAAITT